MTKNRTPTPVYLDPGMHSGLEVKGLKQLKIHVGLCETRRIVLKLKKLVRYFLTKVRTENKKKSIHNDVKEWSNLYGSSLFKTCESNKIN